MPELRHFRLVVDFLLTSVQIARPARRKANSGSFSRLKDTECSKPEREDEGHAPPTKRARQDEDDTNEKAHGKHCNACQEPPLPLSRTDVRTHVFNPPPRFRPSICFATRS
jgi:hypothetical protein